MTAEFDWWLLIVGLVVGAGLVWLILAEWPRRDEELAEEEIRLEAGWIAARLQADGRAVEPEAVEAVLRQHRTYLRLPPPDELPAEPVPAEIPGAPLPVVEPAAVASEPAPAAATPGPTPAAATPGPTPAAPARDPGAAPASVSTLETPAIVREPGPPSSPTAPSRPGA
jgi:hypothetical protein